MKSTKTVPRSGERTVRQSRRRYRFLKLLRSKRQSSESMIVTPSIPLLIQVIARTAALAANTLVSITLLGPTASIVNFKPGLIEVGFVFFPHPRSSRDYRP